MQRKLIKLLTSLIAIAFCMAIYLVAPTYLGIATIGISALCMVKTKNLLCLLLSCLNISTGVAFDYFLRAKLHTYTFYFNNGISGELLCLVSIITFIAITTMASFYEPDIKSGVTIPAILPKFSSFLYIPCVLLILGCITFIISSEKSVFSQTFDAYELQKYPFLEYIGLIVMFAVGSANGGKKKEFIAYIVSAIFILTCLITSYRMVAIVTTLALIFMRYNNKIISKKFVITAWLSSYVVLTAISYLRLGIFDISPENVLGYVNGRLDNTFTGVIETALIYSGVAAKQDITTNLLHLIGTIAPLPNSLLPTAMLYIENVHEVHSGKIPGGGLLAGFFVYFNYLLVGPVFVFLYLAFKKSKSSRICGALYFIAFICIARWWLYGPFVFFKFTGVFLGIYLANLIALNVEKRGFTSSKSTLRYFPR